MFSFKPKSRAEAILMNTISLKIKIDAETKELSYSYCNCKGFEYRKRCYHIDLLKEFVLNNYKEELEKAKEEKKRLAREALEW